MCYSLRHWINRVGAEIRCVTLECCSDFSIGATIGIVGGEERAVILHNVSCHVAGGVINEQAGHVLS
jgi:hypothetical protein